MITPDEFDTLVRDTLRAVDADTQPDAHVADRLIANAREGVVKVVPLRRRATWVAPLIAAAAVVVVALALVLVNNRGGHHAVQPATQVPTTSAPNPSRPNSTAPTTSGPTTSAPTTSAPTSTAPTTTAPSPSPKIAGFRTADVSYLDAQHGWALGDGRCPTGTRSNCPTIQRTTDGGRTWHAVGVPAGLVSTRNYGSCGDNGTITGPCVDQILFATAKIGYLWSYRTMYLTTDGGTQWTDLDTQRVAEVVAVGNTAVRMTTLQPCSDGCQYGVFAAPLGTTNWTNVIPYAKAGGGDWQLAGSSRVAYLLEQDSNQVLYRSTDGRHWTRVVGNGPCGNKQIDTMKVDFSGTLTATCY